MSTFISDLQFGDVVRDEVTGFEGIVTGLGFHKHGDPIALVEPYTDDRSKFPEGTWLNINRLKVMKDLSEPSTP